MVAGRVAAAGVMQQRTWSLPPVRGVEVSRETDECQWVQQCAFQNKRFGEVVNEVNAS